MNWYRKFKTASRIPTDLDIDTSEIDKPYVKKILKEIQENILSNLKLEELRENTKDSQLRSKDKVLKSQIGTINDKKVFFVNGNEVKIKFFMDFVEGGNGMVYGVKHDENQPKCIPKDEIWVDADLDLSSFPYVLVHEAVEMYLMEKENLNYDKAHAKSNGTEKDLREKRFFDK